MRRITVLGAGVAGISVSLLLKKLGYSVFLSEKASLCPEKRELLNRKGIEFEEKGHSPLIYLCDAVVASPGISDAVPILYFFREREVPVLEEVELGINYIKGKIIAVTGTNGKTTVCKWLYEILSKGKEKVFLAGNIGEPISNFAFQEGIFILELSSFQLKRIKYIKPNISMILNIEEDHLDWHRDFNEYKEAKLRIFKNQGKEDFLILDAHYSYIKVPVGPKTLYISTQGECEGAYADEKFLYLSVNGKKMKILAKSQLSLIGPHNVKNALFVLLGSFLAGADISQIKEGLMNFKGLAHRLQLVKEYKGIKIYNDSKSTNPHSVKYALLSFKEPVVLIMGGQDKSLDFSILEDVIQKKCKALVFYGSAKEKLMESIGKSISLPSAKAEDVPSALFLSLKFAKKGDVILFSPGCASFDQYKNYILRGEHFINETAKL